MCALCGRVYSYVCDKVHVSLRVCLSVRVYVIEWTWVYSGVFRDVYGEFMIQVNEDCLSFRGEDAHAESVSQASALAVKMTVNISHTVC